MANIGMDISVEELRRQFSDAVEKLAEQRADLDQATQEVERLRALLEGQEDRNGDLEIEIERLKGELKAALERIEAERAIAYSRAKLLLQMEADRDRLQDESNNQAGSIEKLRAELEKARANTHNWRMQATDLNQKEQQLQSENTRLRELLGEFVSAWPGRAHYANGEFRSSITVKRETLVEARSLINKPDSPLPQKVCACGGKIVPWRDNDLNQIGTRCKKCHTKWRSTPKPNCTTKKGS